MIYVIIALAFGYLVSVVCVHFGIPFGSWGWWSVCMLCASSWAAWPTLRRLCRRHERWEDGSIDGLPARRNLRTGTVEIHHYGEGGWIDAPDPFNDFLPHSREPETGKEWSERLRYSRMSQPTPTQEQIELQFAAARKADRRFPSPSKTTNNLLVGEAPASPNQGGVLPR